MSLWLFCRMEVGDPGLDLRIIFCKDGGDSYNVRIIFCKDVRISRGIRRSDVGTKISWLHLKQTISHRKDKD